MKKITGRFTLILLLACLLLFSFAAPWVIARGGGGGCSSCGGSCTDSSDCCESLRCGGNGKCYDPCPECDDCYYCDCDCAQQENVLCYTEYRCIYSHTQPDEMCVYSETLGHFLCVGAGPLVACLRCKRDPYDEGSRSNVTHWACE